MHHLDAGTVAEHRHHRRVAAAAAADRQPLRPARQQVERLADGGDCECRQRCRAIFRAEPVGHRRGEVEAVERFWVGLCQIRMLEQPLEPCLVDRACSRQLAVAVHLAEPLRLDEIVDRRICRPGVERDDSVLPVPPGDVADAAEIEHSGVAAGVRLLEQRRVIGGCEWRALSAGRHVGRAEIIGDLGAEQRCHQFAVTELAGPAYPSRLRGAVQHRLAVEADDADIGHGHALALDKIHDSGRLRARQRFLGLAEDRWLRPLEVPGARLAQRLFQQCAHRLRVGGQSIGTEVGDALAVGLDQRHVDIAVKHRAGHQADGPDWFHGHSSDRRRTTCRTDRRDRQVLGHSPGHHVRSRLFASNGENGATPLLPLAAEGASLCDHRHRPNVTSQGGTSWQPMSQ